MKTFIRFSALLIGCTLSFAHSMEEKAHLFHQTVMRGTAQEVSQELQNGADPNSSYYKLGTPLVSCAIGNIPEATEKAKLLIKHGALINVCCPARTALHHALSRKERPNLDLIQVLLDNEADPSIQIISALDKHNLLNAAAIAQKRGYTEIASVLNKTIRLQLLRRAAAKMGLRLPRDVVNEIRKQL